jgi:5'-3' exonuclease
MIKIILSAFVAAFLSSCSSSNYATDAMAPGAAPASARQIQRSGSMSMKSRSLKSSSDKSVSLVAKHNALITSSSLTDDRYRASIRVPAVSLPSLMESLESVGKVTSSRVNMTDITAAYLDLDAALKNKRALRDRLRSLLSRATKIEDTLKIEKELSRVQTELDQMEARMKYMRSKVAHSTLDLSITRDRIPGPLGAVKDGTGWVFGKLLYLN